MAGSQAEERGARSEGQRSLFAGPNAVFEHLRTVDFSRVQARLVAKIYELGAERSMDGERRLVLSISDRDLGRECQCSDRAVAKAAATLTRYTWFTERKNARSKRPPTYEVDLAGARSMTSLLDLVRETEPSDRTESNPIEPNRTESNRIEPDRTFARVHPSTQFYNPCPPSNRVQSVPASPVGAGSTAATAGGWPRYPWAREGGVSDRQLVEACRRGDVALLRHLYDHAVRLNWIAGDSDDHWLRFLTGCHHCASASLARRMGRLVTFVKHDRLDTSRMRQRSEQWAGELIGRGRRDPELVRLGRLCGAEAEG